MEIESIHNQFNSDYLHPPEQRPPGRKRNHLSSFIHDTAGINVIYLWSDEYVKNTGS